MKYIRTLIVDDEPLAREKLRHLLDAENDVQVVAECDNGEKALAMVRVTAPEIVFLDINLPGMMGTEIADTLNQLVKPPAVVFVSAHNQFAMKAFELNVLDYLLKPFDPKKQKKAIQKYRDLHQTETPEALDSHLQSLLSQLTRRPRYMERVLIRSGDDILIMKTDDIDWIEAAGNYVYLHTGKKSRLLRETMNNLQEKLDPEKFIRIHRSCIVNIERIRKMQPSSHGELIIVMSDNTELTLTRTYRDNLIGRFEIPA